jgi:hypothetical protein
MIQKFDLATAQTFVAIAYEIDWHFAVDVEHLCRSKRFPFSDVSTCGHCFRDQQP